MLTYESNVIFPQGLELLTERVIKMVCKFMQARLDELLHGRCLVDGAIHDVVDRLDLDRCSALPHLFLGHDSVIWT